MPPDSPNQPPTEGRGDRPLWSVCIPTHQRAGVLSEAIASALAATDGHSAEVLVVDNASTDATEVVVQSFESKKLRYLRFEQLVSLFANHNRCIDASRGEYITFLHSDDVYPDGYFAALVERFRTEPALDILTYVPAVKRLAGDPAANDLAIAIVACGGGVPSGSVYRKSVFQDSPGFDEANVWSDGQLVIDRVMTGASAAHFDYHRPVWVEKPISMSSQADYLRHRRYHCRQMFNAIFTAPYGKHLEDTIVRSYGRLDDAARITLLQRCGDAGRRSLLHRLLQMEPHPMRLLRQKGGPSIVPRYIAPKIYAALHPWLSSFRRAA